MKANEIINTSLKLLGYTSVTGNAQLNSRIMNKAVSIVNVVYADLWNKEHTEEFEPIINLDDEIKLSKNVTDIMAFGVAAFIAQSENDGDQQQLWMSTYNNKLRRLTKITTRKDVLPRGYDL